MLSFFKTALPNCAQEATINTRFLLVLCSLACLPVASQTLAWPIILYCVGIVAVAIKYGNQAWFTKLIAIIVFFVLLIIFKPDNQQSFFSAALVGLTMLKALELRNIRDGQFMLHTALFSLFTGALLLPNIWMNGLTISGTAGILLGHFLLLNPNLDFSWRRLRKLLKKILKITFLTAPVIVLLFYIFPRVGGDFLQIGLLSNNQSGLSDTLRPGDLSELAKGSNTRFRVFSDDTIQNQYYRVYVLEDYDGEQWTQSPSTRLMPLTINETNIKLQIEMEPHNQYWLPSPEWANLNAQELSTGHTINTLQPLKTIWRRDFNVNQNSIVNGTEMSDNEYKRLLALPSNINPQTQALIEAWKNVPLNDILSRLEKLITTSHIYTLSPPTPPNSNHVDFLLFESKQGYCGHYANSITYILRSLGYPARVIIGFQGGEYNPVGQYTQVGDADAHAWVEVYDNAQWQRVDPTAWLAPARLNISANLLRQNLLDGIASDSLIQSSELILQASQSFWLSMKHTFDAIQHGYTLWVIEFDRDRQNQLLKWTATWGGLLVIGIVLVVWLVIRYKNPKDRALCQFDLWLAKRNETRLPHQTPLRWVRQYPELQHFANHWCANRYGTGQLSDKQLIKYLPKD